MPTLVEPGETYDFEFSVSGDATGFVGTMNVLKFPGDSPTISRVMTKDGNTFKGTLTSAETISLGYGQWFIHGTTNDADEDIRSPEKIYIGAQWIV